MHAKLELAELTLSPITKFTFPFTNPTSRRSIAELSLAIQPFAELYKSRTITSAQKEEADSLLDQIKNRRLYNFIMAANARLDSLNTLIDAYNRANTVEDKVKLLDDITVKKNDIDAQFPESATKLCPEYIDAFYEKMATELQSQHQQLAKHHAGSSAPRYPFSQLLQNMPTVKRNRLLQILYDRKQYNDDLDDLYTETEKGYHEFNQFLKNHTISFIGSSHNSSNLLIESTQPPRHSYVLKIENRLNQPQNISQHFAQTALKDVIPQSDIACRAWFLRERGDIEEIVIRTIKILPYYTMGSVYQHALSDRLREQRIKSALRIYQQMGDILLNLSHKGGAFPDMKNSNWLVDDSETLQIADDKSLRWQNDDGTLDVFSDHSQWHGDIIKSLEYMPPEVFQTAVPIVVDTLHVFTWGKDFYEYLTATSNKFEADTTYLKLYNGADFNFDEFSIFFIEPEGPLLQQLIMDTVKPEPTERISMETALVRLGQIQQLCALRASLETILYSTHFSPDIIGKYIQDAISSLDPKSLTDYAQETNRPALLNSVETFQTALRKQYDVEWLAILDKVEKILATHPDEEIQEFYEQCLNNYKDLKPYAYEQFADDLSSLYEAAQSLKQYSTMPAKKT